MYILPASFTQRIIHLFIYLPLFNFPRYLRDRILSFVLVFVLVGMREGAGIPSSF